MHLLSSLLLVVLSLHVLELSSQSLDLILVLVDLSLVHIELSSHSLHLGGLFLQILLIDRKLLGNFWSRLSRQEVLKLNIELFLLLDDNVLFNDLLSLLDQSLLESLDLLEHLPSIRISTLKLSPSMAVQWVLKLLRESFDLESFSQKLLLEVVDLLSQIWDLRSLRLDDSQFTLVITNLELQKSNILESLLILNFTSCESALEDLDLFIEKSELIISSDKLGSKNISFVDHVLIIFLESLNFLLGFLDDVVEFLNLIELLSSEFLTLLVLLFTGLDIVLLLLNEVLILSFDKNFSAESQILGVNFFFELRNLMRSNPELSLKLSNFILSFDQVLGVKISVGSNSLIQVLLLLKLSFKLDILLLELTDQVLLKLHLLYHLHQIGVGFGSLMRESITFLLEVVNIPKEFSDVLLLLSALLLQLGDLILLVGDLILVSVVLILSFLDGLRHHVSEPNQIDNLLFVLLSVSPKMLDFSGKSVNSIFGDVLLILSFFLLSGHSVFVIQEPVVDSVEDLVLLLELSDLVSHLIDLNLEVTDLREKIFSLSLLVFNDVFSSFDSVGALLILLLLHCKLVINVNVLLCKIINILLLDFLVLLEGLDSSVLLLDLFLKVLLLSVEELSVSFELGLLFGKLVDFMLFLHNFFSFFGEFPLKLDDFLVETSFGLFKVVNLSLLVLNVLL